jgi:hypothetical protein
VEENRPDLEMIMMSLNGIEDRLRELSDRQIKDNLHTATNCLLNLLLSVILLVSISSVLAK